MAPKKKTGRPSEYLPEVGDDICNLLMSGESLRSICERPGMPNRTTVFRWIQSFDDFRNQYAHAREVQADVLAEEIIEIADDSSGDVIVDEDGRQQTDHERVARSRLRVDARKWYASKLAPKKYGDRIQHEQTIQITDLSDAELDRKLQELTNAQPQSGAED